MNTKALQTLEFPKILERLARHTSFSGGRELALNLMPTSKLNEATFMLDETTEARLLLEENPERFALGGVFDVRGEVLSTQRGIVLEPATLLDIRSTLRRATTIRRTLTRMKSDFPILANLAEDLEECSALQHEIARVVGEDGNILDSASPKLAMIRRDMKIAFDRLQAKLNSVVNNPNNTQFLQEQLVTQRNGRYVIPLKAEFKGRIPGIIHDQSASGATLWIEPLKTVENNNEYRELQLQEDKEIRRILRELCDLVAHEAEFIVRTIETLSYLDLVFAKSIYAEELNANAPKLVGFRQDVPFPQHPGSSIKLVDARHPMLNPETVVPISVSFDENTYGFVITGPNTGGKTVALKTIGLMLIMAQCGMHIPTDVGSELSVFVDVFVDIGDEQSIEQSLSTFSSHMTNIIDILERANDRSLVILDELGAGTDPAEGSALARAILSRLLDAGITTLVTTHHPELKLYSQERRGIRNASVEFNLETLAPTYRLIVGLPGRSNALAIAERLGLPQDIIEDARSLVGVEDLVADDLLDEITQTREETREAYARAAEAEAEAEELRLELTQRMDDIETERRDVLAEARRKAEYELQELRQEIKRLRKDLSQAGQPLEIIRRLENIAGDLTVDIDVPEAEGNGSENGKQLRLGDTVWVNALMTEGVITEISSEDAEVSVGQMRVRAKLNDLEYRKKSKAEPKERRRDPSPERGVSPGLELDLRGTRVEEAISRTDDYLDAAYMAHLPFVRIIHGKGTGALRRAVRDRLSGNPLVAKYASGEAKEGGDGVTVVTLVENF